MRFHVSVCLLSLAACGVDAMSTGDTTDDTTEITQGIVGGEPTDRWDAVGWVYGTSERCTGTLISPNVFLTAAHCTLQHLPLNVGFGPYRTGAEVTVSDYIRSPDYRNVSPPDPEHDVAVLILSVPISGRTPMPLAGAEYPSVTPPGRELRLVGYGDDKDGLTSPDQTVTAPRKTAHLHVNYAHTYDLGTSGVNGAGCFGDSGGPLMDLDGTKVYAVSSLVFTPCSASTQNAFAAVAWEPFIQQAITDHPPAPYGGSVPLWRYWNGVGLDHFYTYERNDAGYAYYGYGIETTEGRVFLGQWPGTVPLYRYFIGGSATDHFYTTNWNEIGWGAYGYAFERVEGYVFPRYYTGTVALWRYWNPWAVDHFYTINRNDAGYAQFGYVIEAVVGYVYP